MVEATIRALDTHASFNAVHASRGKVVRAEPIAALYNRRCTTSALLRRRFGVGANRAEWSAAHFQHHAVSVLIRGATSGPVRLLMFGIELANLRAALAFAVCKA
jgi:hypothetical protein